MVASEHREQNPAQMQWNLGGWLGGQIGGTAWILLAGLLTLPKNAALGLAVVAIFAVLNGFGYFLWRQRDSRSAYFAMQMLLVVIGIGGCLAIFLLERAKVYEAIQIGGTVSAAKTYVVLIATILGLMFVFYLRFGRQRNGGHAGGSRHDP